MIKFASTKVAADNGVRTKLPSDSATARHVSKGSARPGPRTQRNLADATRGDLAPFTSNGSALVRDDPHRRASKGRAHCDWNPSTVGVESLQCVQEKRSSRQIQALHARISWLSESALVRFYLICRTGGRSAARPTKLTCTRSIVKIFTSFQSPRLRRSRPASGVHAFTYPTPRPSDFPPQLGAAQSCDFQAHKSAPPCLGVFEASLRHGIPNTPPETPVTSLSGTRSWLAPGR